MQILLVLQNLLKAQVKAKIVKLGRLHELQYTHSDRPNTHGPPY